MHVNDTVYVRSVCRGSADEDAFIRLLFDEHALDTAHLLVLFDLADLHLQRHELVTPLVLYPVVQFPRKTVGRGIFFIRVAEDTHLVQCLLFQEGHESRVVLGCFTGKTGDNKGTGNDGADDVERIVELEQELIRVREDYRGVVEELETSNEELKAVNEEMHSSNEELESTNEELESSREELQSLNEELNTVNNRLQTKNEELAEAYVAITDVLNSTKIAVLFLDKDLCVKRFTPEAAALINLVDHDTGRPIGHISHNLALDDLTRRIREVQDTLSPFEDDARTTDGHWYRMRIMAHRAQEKFLEGAVITFVNIDAQKKAQEDLSRLKEKELLAEKRFSHSIVNTVRESLLVLDKNFCVLSANSRFYHTFQTGRESVEGKSLFELGNGQWDIPGLKTLLAKITADNKTFEDYTVEQTFPKIGKRRMLLNARRLENDEDKNGREVLLAIEDVTDRLQKED